jgi:hypothetical protein
MTKSQVTVELRLERLEREVRTGRRRSGMLALALVVVATVGATTGPGPSSGETIRSRRVEILDEHGRAVLRLDATPRGGRLQLIQAEGAPALDLFVTEAGGRVAVYNAKGRFGLAAGNDQFGGALTVASATGSVVTTVRVNEKGEGTLEAWNGHGAGKLLTPTGVRNPPKHVDEDEQD